VDDHCRAIESILKNGREGSTYNVGSGDEHSIEDIADLVLEAVGRSSTLKRYVPDRPGHDRRYLLDHSKIQRELGWNPKISFGAGLRDTIHWYEAHRDWWSPKKTATLASLDEFRWNGTASVESSQ
jgi:dTDP-glucose 4,6-dehydratase